VRPQSTTSAKSGTSGYTDTIVRMMDNSPSNMSRNETIIQRMENTPTNVSRNETVIQRLRSDSNGSRITDSDPTRVNEDIEQSIKQEQSKLPAKKS
jgi:hypothetical protein